MITVIHVDIDGGYGGSARSLYELIKRLDRTKINPVVVTRQIGPSQKWYSAIGVSFHHVPEIGSFVPRETKVLRNFLATLPRLVHLKSAAKKISDIARRENANLIHLNYEGLFLLANQLKMQTNLNIIAHCRTQLPENFAAKWLVRRLSRSISKIFYITENEKNGWLSNSQAGCRPVPGSIMFNIASSQGERPLPVRPFEVSYFGNLDHSKGTDRVIDVAKEVTAIDKSFLFRIYGMARNNKHYEGFLRRRIAECGLHDVIQLMGHSTDIPKILTQNFCVIRPSRMNDPWGRDLIEATAAGVPAIATGQYAGVIHHNKTGFLFPAFDAVQFSEAILSLRDVQRWEAFSKAAQRLAREKFSGDTQVKEFTESALRYATHHCPDGIRR